MEQDEIAKEYNMDIEELQNLEKELRDNLFLGKGNTIDAINIAFPDVNDKERAKIFILFHIAKYI